MRYRLVRRCLYTTPERRLPSAAAFMHAFDGCRDLLQLEKDSGRQGWLDRACGARPFAMLVLLATIPHLLGSVVNVLYNGQLIVNKSAEQQACFERLVIGYNGMIYPLVLL